MTPREMAALDDWITGKYAPGDECLCPTDCVTCQQDAPGIYCCGECIVEDEGEDPDDARDRRIEREMEERDDHAD